MERGTQCHNIFISQVQALITDGMQSVSTLGIPKAYCTDQGLICSPRIRDHSRFCFFMLGLSYIICKPIWHNRNLSKPHWCNYLENGRIWHWCNYLESGRVLHLNFFERHSYIVRKPIWHNRTLLEVLQQKLRERYSAKLTKNCACSLKTIENTCNWLLHSIVSDFHTYTHVIKVMCI